MLPPFSRCKSEKGRPVRGRGRTKARWPARWPKGKKVAIIFILLILFSANVDGYFPMVQGSSGERYLAEKVEIAENGTLIVYVPEPYIRFLDAPLDNSTIYVVVPWVT